MHALAFIRQRDGIQVYRHHHVLNFLHGIQTGIQVYRLFGYTGIQRSRDSIQVYRYTDIVVYRYTEIVLPCAVCMMACAWHLEHARTHACLHAVHGQSRLQAGKRGGKRGASVVQAWVQAWTCKPLVLFIQSLSPTIQLAHGGSIAHGLEVLRSSQALV